MPSHGAGPLLHRLGGLVAGALEGHGLAANATDPGRDWKTHSGCNGDMYMYIYIYMYIMGE